MVIDPLVLALDRAVPKSVRTISRVLREGGHRGWIVGGCVRDVVLAKLSGSPSEHAGDWDMCTDARPEEVQALFRKVIPTGIEHGTVTVVLGGEHFEITTLRGERGHSDGRRPDEVFFVRDLEQDLARRDFTVNAMAYDVEAKTFHDPFGGKDDATRRVLRAVGDPLQRFSEDGLRVLRGARFCSTLNMDLERETAEAIRPSLQSFAKVARERVRDEWFKALKAEHPSRFVRVILERGLLEITLPFVFPGCDSQDESFACASERLDQAPRDPILRLAILSYLGTRQQSRAELAQIPERMRLSRAESARLALMISEAQPPQELLAAPTGQEVRRWLSSVGRDQIHDVFLMQVGVRSSTVSEAILAELHERARQELAAGAPLNTRDLCITGAHLISEAGVPKGREVGRVLQLLLDDVLQDPSNNRRDHLLERARSARKNHQD